MNSRILIFLVFVARVLIAQEITNNQIYLEGLVQEAIIKSPKIKEYKAKLKVFAERTKLGTNLPDPKLTLGLVNMPTNSFSFSQEPMTGKILGLSQGIPFPGSLGAKSKVKAADTSIVNSEIEDLKKQNKKRSGSKIL